MGELTRNNLQLFCRTCLSALLPTADRVFNIHMNPNLSKLLMIYTSLNFEEDDVFPKNLCRVCYDKVQDFQLFRSMVQTSNVILNGIIKGDQQDEDSTSNIENEEENCQMEPMSSGKQRYQSKNDYNKNPDDDQLESIKTEPIDVERQEVQDHEKHFFENKVIIKEENHSEIEDNSNSNRNNITDESYNPTDDEHNENGMQISLLNYSTSGPSTLAHKRNSAKKSLKCPLCDKQAYKQVYLDAHVRSVHEGHEKPFLCMQCGKEFTRYNQLHLHIQSFHKKFLCEFDGCGAKFGLMKTLETHRKVSHPSDLTPPFSLSLQDVLHLHHQLQSEDMEHMCQQCSKKYNSKRALTEHLKRHTKIKEHVCKVCGVAKLTRPELQIHMRTHEPNAEKFKCTLCPQQFNHKNSIQRHIRAVHEGMRPYLCNYCPKRFGTRNSKKCHERLHIGERPFACELCNKKFTQCEGLKSHMKNHDKSLRTHVCKFCSQRFITKKNLMDHEDRHRGDKPHICDICSKGYSKADDLFKHKQSHEDRLGPERNKGFNSIVIDSPSSLDSSKNKMINRSTRTTTRAQKKLSKIT